MTSLSRPEQSLQSLLREYPKLSQRIDSVIQNKSTTEMTNQGKVVARSWPDDVFIPFGIWMAIENEYYPVEGLEENPIAHPGFFIRVNRLAAVGAWRYSKGIYKFSKVLYDALTDTPLPDTIPLSVFRRLPDWCPYLELPEQVNGINGYYCYLDYEYRTGAWELRIYPDSSNGMETSLPFELTNGITLVEAFASYRDEIAPDWAKNLLEKYDVKGEFIERITPAISLLLYLCQDEPEIDDMREPGISPGRNYPKKIKGGYRLFEPVRTRTWEVGKSVTQAISEGLRGPGAKKAPHIRRAHWHGYWTGPRKGERTFGYRWIPPIAVNVDDAPENSDETSP